MSDKDEEKQKTLSANGNTKYVINFSNTDPKKDVEILKENNTITNSKETAWTVGNHDHNKIQYDTSYNIFYSSEDSMSPNYISKKKD